MRVVQLAVSKSRCHRIKSFTCLSQSCASDPRVARDPRVDVLARLCRSLSEPDAGHAQRQRDIIALWMRIEQASRRIPASLP